METAIVAVLATPIIIFMVIVAPIWLVLHYRSKNKMSQGLSEQEAIQFRELVQKAEQLKERVRSLERILDQEHPDWRKYN
ncbi:envelope stress response membrane protein PspB [Aliidiomarina quisquiliarum]|uniref:envelope stress response membrane protein PspB n=1 Tax=Aliidiomarina quisquiliarum TaxID=2938947 RepID=UPI00208E689C|nr:envelope stress response membrane protein PspB [Aliidiomarina quisquiliarum]MCO4320612.1 envelope stress response membrane protein PspB [Aliidiomarina quisquiliarum]